ncbi:cation:proton antiporter family protein [Serinibacter salmoneus]|uniref:Putative Kef-type K+ transport protein n=1 Tax=Serinibacter salmoneus TaxID=556530 RepID=A0A2A9D3B6_9MICO|nr:cation:proton antiporter family protein [Serinibacter salmoneus]PFG20836.1 putative Kef-type K+ transport protein [Serinibacter salmoneus]
MDVAAIYLSVTIVLGLLAVALRLPPLVGFLAAGFALNWMDVPDFPALETIADVGVTLLLFGIGLKLDLRTLIRREVWLTATAHMVLSVAFGTGVLWLCAVVGLPLLTGQSMTTFVLLAFALSFSSTVFVVKVLEERGESHSLYGRVAIGILVIQDIAAVIFLTATSGELPSPWAFALVLLWPASKLFRAVWSRIGHGEMQSLFGVVMALVPGYWLFDAVGLKGDLGALVMGMLLASHRNSSELSRSLFHIKELLLVGFFVSIGLTGLPDLPLLLLALGMVLLLPFKALGYVVLLWLMRLRVRSSLLAGLALTNYSEFGLIVVALGVEAGMLGSQWLVEISIAVAISFVFAALVNGRGHLMVEKLAERLPHQPTERMLPEERPTDAGDAEVVVIGMGRVGVAAYDRLSHQHGLRVVGVDYDDSRVSIHESEGRHVVQGDATDLDFWRRMRRSGSVRTAVLSMHEHGSNITALECLRESGFTGQVVSVARYADELAVARENGVDAAFNLYAAAGLEVADQAWRLAQGEEADADANGTGLEGSGHA